MDLINSKFKKNFYFYKLPKKLFKSPYNKLSANAKLCYMFLLNRTSLSIVNNYVDDNYNVFVYYTRENLQNDLYISKGTAIKVFKELIKANLIKEVKHNSTFKIYLYDIFDNDYEVKKMNQDSPNFIPNKVKKLYPNKNNKNYNNYEQRDYSNMSEEWWNQLYENK